MTMTANSRKTDCRADISGLNYIALIPAYEPDGKLLSVIDELTRAGFETVVVDDGSGPEYRDIFLKAERRAAVISYDRNMGKGAALKTGLAYIYDYRCGRDVDINPGTDKGIRPESVISPGVGKSNLSESDAGPGVGKSNLSESDAGSDIGSRCPVEKGVSVQSCRGMDAETIIVTVDADGQHRTKDVIRVARSAAKHKGTLVLGSRDFSSAVNDSAGSVNDRGQNGNVKSAVKIPLRSRFGNTVTGHVFRLSTGVPVSDTQTGLRAFSADLIPELLEIRGKRYEYEINMLLDFAAGKIPIREERIDTVYIDNNSSSHFNAVKDSFRVYKEILKFSASSLIGFMTDYIVFALLTLLTPSVAAANIGARLVSSVTNYTINRKYVFGSRKKVSTSALQYFTLAALILAGNTMMLSTLTGSFSINCYAAKIITELVFFIISWTVQRYIIFYNDDVHDNSEMHRENPEAAAGDTDSAGNVRFIVKRRAVRTPKLRSVISADVPGGPEGRLD